MEICRITHARQCNVEPLATRAWVCICMCLSLALVLMWAHCVRKDGSVRFVPFLHLLFFGGDSLYNTVWGECHWPGGYQNLCKMYQKCPATDSVHGALVCAPCFPHHRFMRFLPFPTTLYFCLMHLQYESNRHYKNLLSLCHISASCKCWNLVQLLVEHHYTAIKL